AHDGVNVDGALTTMDRACTEVSARDPQLLSRIAPGAQRLCETRTTVLNGLRSMRAQPLTLAGLPRPIDDTVFAHFIFKPMYSRSPAAQGPLFVQMLAARAPATLSRLLGQVPSLFDLSDEEEGGEAEGMPFSVVCNELFTPADVGAWDRNQASIPA